MQSRFLLRFRTMAIACVIAPLAIATTPGCSSGPIRTEPASVTLDRTTVELPAEFVDEKIIVEVMINATGPHRMILDTGSAVCQVSPALARMAKLRRAGSVRTIDAHGGVYREPIANALLLRSGDFSANSVPMTIQDLPSTIAEGPRAVGILGFNVFRDATLILDYPAHRVLVSRQGIKANASGVVPMDIFEEHVPFIDADFRIAGSDPAFPTSLLLDTGSGAGLTLGRFPAALFADTERADIGASMSANGTIRPATFARLHADMHLGSITVTRLTALIDEQHTRDSSLGDPILRHFRVSIDTPSGLARFEHPDALTEIAMPLHRVHGIQISLENSDLPVVASINPGSPAEAAGLRPGDTIVSIDGGLLAESLDYWPGVTLNDSITHRDFVIERDGEELAIRLELAEYLPEPKVLRQVREHKAKQAEQAAEPQAAKPTVAEPAPMPAAAD